MKKSIATLIAGLLASAAFAQTTPAPATPATSAPQSAVSPEVAKAQAAHEKEAAKADAKGDKKATGKKAKKAVPAKVQDKSKMPVDEHNTTASTGAAVAPDTAK